MKIYSNLNKISSRDWKKKIKTKIKDVIIYNENNTILKKNLFKLGFVKNILN